MINEAYIEQKSRELLKKIKSARSEIKVEGKTFYVSAEGDDEADGLTPGTAIKSLDAVNELKALEAGDAVLLRRGDIFRGHLEMKPGVTYSAFGVGEKPQIWAATENAVNLNWEQVDNFIYKVYIPHRYDIGCIVFNHGEEWGYKRFLEGDTDIILDKEFYHDIEGNALYLYSEKGNPSERWADIELCPRVHNIHGRADNVTIDGLILKYGGAHGISTSSIDYPVGKPEFYRGCKNFTVRNCEFEWIGGSVQFKGVRFGNGLEIWGGCENHVVENCYFNQCYDAAVTQQYQGRIEYDENNLPKVKNVLIKGCLFENNIYCYEYFLTQKDNDKKNMPDTVFAFENVLFEDNICRGAGYGWGNQRPDRTTSALIKSWGHNNNSENFVIRNNIFDRGDYCLVEVLAHYDKCLPKLENNIYNQYLGKGIVRTNSGLSVMTREALGNPAATTHDENGILLKAFH